MENNDFFDYITLHDPLGLSKPTEKTRNKSQRSVLLNNFEEIVSFFEDTGHVPNKKSKDIKEFQLACRLESIRHTPSMVKELRDYDLNGLLSGDDVSDVTLDDIVGNDPLNLLDMDYDTSLFELTHVQKSERISPEYISRREFCKDFDKYEPMFESVNKSLEDGSRKLAVYRTENLAPGKFYVLNGILLFLESVDGNYSDYKYNSGHRIRYDGRTKCIFDNGTVSDMLYRSLDKALQKDGYGITEFDESLGVQDHVTEQDIVNGYVYVLKSQHPRLRNEEVYKIGSTTSTVSDRIKNAYKEATYLYSGVDVIETYKCFNIQPRELEDKLHDFFDSVRLNINIPDKNGVVISPREWFRVNLQTIKEAVQKIIDHTINDYTYDSRSRKIIAKNIERTKSDS